MSGYTVTPNYNLRKPIVGADNDAWGGNWNLNADTLDTQLKNVSNAQLPKDGSAPMSGPLTTTALNLPNTTLYEVADGANSIIVQDDFGFVALVIEGNGILDAGTMTANTITVLRTLNMPATGATDLTGDSLILANFAITDITDGRNDVLFSDEFGFVAFGILGIDGSMLGGGGSGGSGGGTDDPNSFYPSLLTARDAMATAQSMSVRDNTNSKVATPIWNYNHVISYGQSLALGFSSQGRLSLNEGLDNLCLGARPAGTQPDGSAFFTPSDSTLHNLDSAFGAEVPAIGATNQLRKLELRWRGLATDPTRRLIVNACGQGGQSIEQLSKGASPELYQQIPSLITQTKAAVTALGASNTYGVVAVYYIQGEANYITTFGFDNTQAGYLAKWEQLKSDLSADIMALTGQQYPPAFITVQTSSIWDQSGDICAIGNAQLQAAITTPYGDYLASPNYYAPNDGPGNGHLNSDGYRWIGLTAGHVMHKVLDRGEGWLPMYTTRASFRGNQILVECHTPEPPIQKQQTYLDPATGTVVFADCGFLVGDNLGAFAISSVQLLNSVILLTVNRALVASQNPWIQYADHTVHTGDGNICDSDPFSALDPFTQTGQPYPMFNFLVAFRMSIVSDV